MLSQEDRELFQALTSGTYVNFALVSVLYQGRPSSAICAVTCQGEEYTITPLFLRVDSGIQAQLQDSDGMYLEYEGEDNEI